MPLLSTFGSSSSKSYGTTGILPGGSAFFNAVGARFAIISPNPATQFAYGTGNFTIEMWMYPTSFSQNSVLWRQATGTATQQVFLYTSITSGTLVYNQLGINVFGGVPTLNSWNHVAVVRNSGSVRIYLNGTGFTAVAAAASIGNPNIFPVIGQNLSNSTANRFFGYITNVRITRQALYTANFTPSRVPFTRTSQGASSANVALLLNMRTSATVATDSSASPVTIDNNLVTFNALSPYTVPFVTPPSVVIVSAAITPSTLTPAEGDTITFTVVGTNTPNGAYFYTIEEEDGTGVLTSADFTSGSLSGTFTMTTNSGSFTLTLVKDLLTETAESFRVFVRQTSTAGPIIGSTNEIVITDSSLTPAFTVTPTSINEGSSGSFTVQNVGPDGTYYWTILNGTTTNADFTATSGSFSVTGGSANFDNGTGSFTVGITSDRVTEGNEIFQVEVRSGSVSGPILIVTTVTINDTSLTPSFDVQSTSINEGSIGSFTAKNLGPAGTYYWTILHGTTNDADFSAVSGSFTTSTLNGQGNFNINPIRDYTTEGSQTYQVQVREGSTSGTVLLTSSVCTVNDTSQTPNVNVSTNPVSEGGTTTITVSDFNGIPNGTYYWTILNGTTTNADFPAVNGSFTIIGNTGNFVIGPIVFTDGSEPAETFQVQIRIDSISGTVIATTPVITITAN